VESRQPLRGKDFGSYSHDEVGWLLKDLSEVQLELPVDVRERRVQLEGGHYSESLPIEYAPSPTYMELFELLLATWAGPVAEGVAVLGDLVLSSRGPDVVLVSLARAGTPIGILLRRWLQQGHGLSVDHYSISIIRGKGLDTEAVAWLDANVGLERVVFVDGWTGKGAIAACLAQSATELSKRGFAGLDPQLAVITDPAGVTHLCATRADIVIPSSCLNSTVSGLVSRTVHSDRLIGPGEFHGAKYYRHLSPHDLSAHFLDTVSSKFGSSPMPPREQVLPPQGSGLLACQAIAERFGIRDLNLVKPGIGEATRVLLRRRPACLLVRDSRDARVQHLLNLAADRGVPVEQDAELAFEAVGLIERLVP
jgi:Phosphoribosyl transferase (PRTase)/PELOTA RNA binding domain